MPSPTAASGSNAAVPTAVKRRNRATRAARKSTDAKAGAAPKKSAPRTNAEMTAHTTRRILRATCDSVAALGYAGTTLAIISEKVGVSRTALLYHFRSKDELMVAAIGRIFDDLQDYHHQDANPASTISERIVAALKKSYLWTQSPDHTALMELSLAARRSPSLGALVNAALHQHNSRFDVEWDALLLSAGIPAERSGLIRDFGVSTLRGLSLSRLLKGDAASIERQMQMLTRIVVEAIELPA